MENQKKIQVHKLVAQAFISNPLHLPEVNHKSEVKSENHVSNLEWCDRSYNNNYGTRTKRAISKMVQHPNWIASHEKCGKPKKTVLQFTLNGEFVAEYPSTREASRQAKIAQSSISSCCNGRKSHNTAGGYLWKYKEEVE